MIRKRKKINKLRGSRTCGGGCTKKRRGAGHRGGRGYAGSKKHKKVQISIDEPLHFGKHGFKVPISMISPTRTINLKELDRIASKFDGEKAELDLAELGFDKVLGAGRMTRPVVVKAKSFSAKAQEKIAAAGGEVITE